MIVVVRRAVRGFGALVGGLAGIASDVSIITKRCGAILGSPYPDTILGGTPHLCCAPWWHHESALPAVVAPRIPTWLVSG
jgi:hypothetical protein